MSYASSSSSSVYTEIITTQTVANLKSVPRYCLTGFMSSRKEDDGPNNIVLSLIIRMWVTGSQKGFDGCEAVKLPFPTISIVESYNLHIF